MGTYSNLNLRMLTFISSPMPIIMVMIDEPRAGRYYGGEVAGPVFANVMAETLRLLNVSPDLPLDAAVRVAEAGVAR